MGGNDPGWTGMYTRTPAHTHTLFSKQPFLVNFFEKFPKRKSTCAFIRNTRVLFLPPRRTLCEGSTSAGRLRPAIFYRGLTWTTIPLIKALWNQYLKVSFQNNLLYFAYMLSKHCIVYLMIFMRWFLFQLSQLVFPFFKCTHKLAIFLIRFCRADPLIKLNDAADNP